MGARTRRFVAMLGALAFLAFYIWAVLAIHARLPTSPLTDILVFGIGGIAWGIPLIPLFRWAERGKQ